MKVHSNFTGQKSTKRLIAFSCATALANLLLSLKACICTEEAKVDNSSNLDVTATVLETGRPRQTKVVKHLLLLKVAHRKHHKCLRTSLN